MEGDLGKGRGGEGVEIEREELVPPEIVIIKKQIAVISVAPICTRDGSPGTGGYRHVCGKKKRRRKEDSLEIVIEQVSFEGAFQRGRTFRVAECWKQTVAK